MTQQSKQLRRFNRLVGETDAVYHELANRLGLSDSAFQILYTLQSEDGACPLRDICAFSGLTKQTVNSALRKLEAEGRVTTESSARAIRRSRSRRRERSLRKKPWQR